MVSSTPTKQPAPQWALDAALKAFALDLKAGNGVHGAGSDHELDEHFFELVDPTDGEVLATANVSDAGVDVTWVHKSFA